jgi:hypothetical protein
VKETSHADVCRDQSGRLVGLNWSARSFITHVPFLLPGRIEAEPPDDSLYCMRPGLEAVCPPGEAPSWQVSTGYGERMKHTSKRSRVGLPKGVIPPMARLPKAPGKARPVPGLETILLKLIRAGLPHDPF